MTGSWGTFACVETESTNTRRQGVSSKQWGGVSRESRGLDVPMRLVQSYGFTKAPPKEADEEAGAGEGPWGCVCVEGMLVPARTALVCCGILLR
jgi:hypothetical protein